MKRSIISQKKDIIAPNMKILLITLVLFPLLLLTPLFTIIFIFDNFILFIFNVDNLFNSFINNNKIKKIKHN